MLDRLISGAGALTDRADRFVRLFSSRPTGDAFGRRPGSTAVAAGLVVLAVILAIAGLEATDDPMAREMSPDLGPTDDVGSRRFASISGGIASGYVETYGDDNFNGVQDANEETREWFYFLVDPGTRAGVTVRSDRAPSDVFRFKGSGEVVEDATYLADDATYFSDTLADLGVTLDDKRLLDTTISGGAAPQLVDLATGLPGDGSLVTVAGQHSGAWIPVCFSDPNDNGTCDEVETTSYDLIVYDEESKRGIVVVTAESPEFPPATFDGMLHRDERAVSETLETQGLGFDELDIAVSARYVLDEGARPASAPMAFALAALCGLLAGVILVGLAGGYLVYRRDERSMPEPATSLAIGEGVALRVTGVLRAANGSIHVREAPADLVRFQTTGVPAPAPPELAPPAPPEVAAPASADMPVEPGSTLIIERYGRPEGVALGLGELQRLTSGSVFPLRGARPALRAVAGTGTLFLSFDTEAERDRVAAELLDETGLAGSHVDPVLPTTAATNEET